MLDRIAAVAAENASSVVLARSVRMCADPSHQRAEPTIACLQAGIPPAYPHEAWLPSAGGAVHQRAHNSIGKPPCLHPRVDPCAFLAILRTYFTANIPDDEGGFVLAYKLAYNLMMFAIVAACLAAIHLAFDERQRRSVKRCFSNLVASMKKGWRGLGRRGFGM